VSITTLGPEPCSGEFDFGIDLFLRYRRNVNAVPYTVQQLVEALAPGWLIDGVSDQFALIRF